MYYFVQIKKRSVTFCAGLSQCHMVDVTLQWQFYDAPVVVINIAPLYIRQVENKFLSTVGNFVYAIKETVSKLIKNNC